MLISFHEAGLILNLIPLENDYTAEGMTELKEEFREEGINLVHIWEDLWRMRKQQVLNRVQSMLGGNERIHARKTRVQRITALEAAAFLDANHVQGAVKAKYKLALMQGDQMVAVACFSNLRLMTKSPAYRSAELVRFANLAGFTVTGGLTKLLKYFMEAYQPDDIMSYADRDWSDGNAYVQAGFELMEVMPPAEIYVDRSTLNRYFAHRRPPEGDFIKIFNTGNLKYILRL